ncbi:MAG: DUF2478 domain-containing protein [Hyphomicrobiaceae bacterium]
MTDTTQPILAAIEFQNGEGDAVDAVLFSVVDRLRADNCDLVGAIKHRGTPLGRTRCDMALEELSSGQVIPISQDLGPQSNACSLDFSALEHAAGLTLSGLERGSDFLILNRFGKREANGDGFRSALENAVGQQVPCVLGVGKDHIKAWQEFTGPLGIVLPCDVDAVWDWCSKAQVQASESA